MKQYNQDMSKSKMAGMFFVALLMMGFMSVFSTAYAVRLYNNSP